MRCPLADTFATLPLPLLLLSAAILSKLQCARQFPCPTPLLPRAYANRPAHNGLHLELAAAGWQMLQLQLEALATSCCRCCCWSNCLLCSLLATTCVASARLHASDNYAKRKKRRKVSYRYLTRVITPLPLSLSVCLSLIQFVRFALHFTFHAVALTSPHNLQELSTKFAWNSHKLNEIRLPLSLSLSHSLALFLSV